MRAGWVTKLAIIYIIIKTLTHHGNVGLGACEFKVKGLLAHTQAREADPGCQIGIQAPLHKLDGYGPLGQSQDVHLHETFLKYELLLL